MCQHFGVYAKLFDTGAMSIPISDVWATVSMNLAVTAVVAQQDTGKVLKKCLRKKNYFQFELFVISD